MIVLCMIALIIIVIVATGIALKRLQSSLDIPDVHPECMICDEESCVGCPMIEAKVGRIK